MEKRPFTIGYYFSSVNRLLTKPRDFFKEMPADGDFNRPLGVLLVSSLLFAFAGLSYGSASNPLLMGAVYFANAVGMTIIAAGLGYMTMVMLIGKKTGFRGFFRIYAMASGVTLLAAWVPFFLMITEPWKWWLIGIGMTRSLNFSVKQALGVIVISIGVMILLFRSILPMIAA